MPWALKRQLFYITILILFFLVLGFLIVSPYINKIPTCVDNKKNGDELGVDCGGSCVRLCAFQAEPISLLWVRTFEVVPGRYNAIAYLENHNRNAAVQKIKYKFNFSDQDNIYIGKREGETFIPAIGKFAIFEPGIGVGNSIPVYSTFEFTEMPLWSSVPEDKLSGLRVLTSDVRLENQNTNPYMSAVIKNYSLFSIPQMSIVVLLYDESGNVISASSTYIDELLGGESQNISFTWPQPILGNVIAKEIIPMYDVFLVKLK